MKKLLSLIALAALTIAVTTHMHAMDLSTAAAQGNVKQVKKLLKAGASKAGYSQLSSSADTKEINAALQAIAPKAVNAEEKWIDAAYALKKYKKDAHPTTKEVAATNEKMLDNYIQITGLLLENGGHISNLAAWAQDRYEYKEGSIDKTKNWVDYAHKHERLKKFYEKQKLKK